jgi:hypothetical protein
MRVSLITGHIKIIKTSATFPSKKNLPGSSVLNKKIKWWNLKKTLLSYADLLTGRRLRVVDVTWRMFLRCNDCDDVGIMDWTICVMRIPVPLASWTLSLSWYCSFVACQGRWWGGPLLQYPHTSSDQLVVRRSRHRYGMRQLRWWRWEQKVSAPCCHHHCRHQDNLSGTV